MAQHDYVIANQSGASFRADLNNGLAAIVSNNSGASAPSTTFAFQWWADTTNNLLKMRNAANDGWITIRQLDGEYDTIGLENGTAAAPSLFFAGSGTDTGLFSGGADQVNVSTGGTERAEFGTAEVVFNDGGANYDFRIEGDTNTNLVVVDASTDRIGVGTNAPGTLIEIDNSAPYVTLKNNTEEDTAGGRESRLIFEGEQSGGEISTLAQIEVSHDGTADDEAGQLIFSTNDGSDGATPTAAVTIDSSQRLLVGTSATRGVASVTPQLLVEGLSANTSTIGIAANSNDTQGGFLALGKSRGTADGANTIVQSGDSLGEIRFAGADGTDLISEAARIGVAVDGTPGSNDMPGRLTFSTTPDGAATPTERMRISQNGAISIGHTSSGNAKFDIRDIGSTWANGLYVQRTNLSTSGQGIYSYMTVNTGLTGTSYATYSSYVAATNSPGGGCIGVLSSVYGILGYFDNTNSWGGYFNGSTYATGSYQSSDERLKENIVEIEPQGVLDKLDSIRSVKYTWKEDSTQYRGGCTGTEIGFLAQEVQPHFPEVVTEVDCSACNIEEERTSLNHELGTTYGVDYAKMVPVLLAALKEAKTRIETLETKVAALEAA